MMGRRTVACEIEQRVASETRGLAHDGGGSAARLAGDLAVAGAREQSVEQGLEQLGALEVIAG